jgi:transposase
MAHLSHAGIDVASDRLDVMLLPDGRCFWVANNPAGWAELVTRLRGLCIAAIGIEASGGYERGVILALLANKLIERPWTIMSIGLRDWANGF